MNVVMIVGARPNYMKTYPIYKALFQDHKITLIHTGQHFDDKMNHIFFQELNFPKPSIQFSLKSKTRAGILDNLLYNSNNNNFNKDDIIDKLLNYNNIGQIGEIRDKLYNIFLNIKPDLVIVFGDVTSTLAGAIAAKKSNIKLAHVESGLRSFDMNMPEEVNRILVDHITDYYFITEKSGVDNLIIENKNKNLFLVGNPMIECLLQFTYQALKAEYNKKLDISDYILITLHRPSNVDNIDKLHEIVNDIIDLSKRYKIVFVIHPRTKENLEKYNLLDKMNDITICDPLGYLDFLCLQINSICVITDSGGVQEETTALGIRCFTLRENTERPSTLIENGGTNMLINKITPNLPLDQKIKLNDNFDHNQVGYKIKNIINNIFKN